MPLRFFPALWAALLASTPHPSDARTGQGLAVAVLEFRSGTGGAEEIGERVARQLEQLTSLQVTSPAEARRRIGPGLDVEVARCKGDAACVAGIGAQLSCDEVLLVGVSQLGDLILAVQRIEVTTGQVTGRLADSLGPAQAITDEDVARYLRRLLPPEHFSRYGFISVRSDRPGDEVYVDQAFRGTTPMAALKVPAPARYSLRVSRPGHQDFSARLDVLPGATVEVNPSLGRVSSTPPWYKRWWVWAIVGGVVAAGAAATAAGLSARTPEQVPAVIRLGP